VHSASSAVGGGSSTGWPQVRRAFFPGDGRCALRVPESLSADPGFPAVQIVLKQNCTARSRASRRLPIIQIHHAAEMRAGKWKFSTAKIRPVLNQWGIGSINIPERFIN